MNTLTSRGETIYAQSPDFSHVHRSIPVPKTSITTHHHMGRVPPVMTSGALYVEPHHRKVAYGATRGLLGALGAPRRGAGGAGAAAAAADRIQPDRYIGRFDSRRFVQPCNLADVTVEQQLRGRLNGRRCRSCTNAYVCTLGAARTNRQAKRLWRGLSFLFENHQRDGM